MKHFITSILLSAIFTISAFAQNTTEEEYNWMTKGYKTMVVSGLDMKSGYYFGDAMEWSQEWSNYKFTFKTLVREGGASIAGTLIIAYSSGSGNTYYYCLPTMDFDGENYSQSELMKKFYQSVWELDDTMTDVFFATLAYRFSKMTTYCYTK